MKKETVGDLRLNSTDDTVLGLIGEPEDRSPARIWGADGREHQSWYYPARGLELGMVRAGDGQKVERICLKSPCELKTGRGIGIGSTEEEVRAAYREEIDLQAPGAGRLVAGTIYGGVIFALENGVVSSIFIGAGAE